MEVPSPDTVRSADFSPSVSDSPEGSPTKPHPGPLPPRPRWRWRIAAGLLLGCLVLSGLVFWKQFWPEVDFLPKGCERADGATIVSLGGKKLYDRIAFVFPDGSRAVFLWIEHKHENDPPSFYIMQDKVSNKLFLAFAKANPAAVKDSQWEKGGLVGDNDLGIHDESLPVMRVTLEEAHQFARWLGGELPTARQWDKAAGRLDGQKSSFQGNADDLKPGEIAINRGNEGPMPVGTAARDASIFGCRDMAGNGREWTCTIARADDDNELASFSVGFSADIRLRGQSYLATEPFRFALVPDQHPAQKPRPDIGFRVVINLLSPP
jgi:hypothetical protein